MVGSLIEIDGQTKVETFAIPCYDRDGGNNKLFFAVATVSTALNPRFPRQVK